MILPRNNAARRRLIKAADAKIDRLLRDFHGLATSGELLIASEFVRTVRASSAEDRCGFTQYLTERTGPDWDARVAVILIVQSLSEQAAAVEGGAS